MASFSLAVFACINRRFDKLIVLTEPYFGIITTFIIFT